MCTTCGFFGNVVNRSRRLRNHFQKSPQNARGFVAGRTLPSRVDLIRGIPVWMKTLDREVSRMVPFGAVWCRMVPIPSLALLSHCALALPNTRGAWFGSEASKPKPLIIVYYLRLRHHVLIF